MTNELIIYNQSVAEVAPVATQKMLMQITNIQDAMRSVMKEGVHYGTIPGTEKPVLLKPGAEKLLMMFRLIPTFEIKEKDLGEGHREVTVTTTIKSLDGTVCGMGVGSCSTKESKYRWREDKREQVTDIAVPKQYWDLRRQDAKQAQDLLNKLAASKGLNGRASTKKVDGQWMVSVSSGTGEKVENPDIADCYNTVLKMATKRSLVGAAIFTLSVSDLFDQDIDETLLASSNPAQQPAPRPELTVEQVRAAQAKQQAVKQPVKQEIIEVSLEDDDMPDWAADAVIVTEEEQPAWITEAQESGQGLFDYLSNVEPAKESQQPVQRHFNIPYNIDGFSRDAVRAAQKAIGMRWEPSNKTWYIEALPTEPAPKLVVMGNDGVMQQLNLAQYEVK